MAGLTPVGAVKAQPTVEQYAQQNKSTFVELPDGSIFNTADIALVSPDHGRSGLLSGNEKNLCTIDRKNMDKITFDKKSCDVIRKHLLNK